MGMTKTDAHQKNGGADTPVSRVETHLDAQKPKAVNNLAGQRA
jgi:hypothetical protein